MDVRFFSFPKKRMVIFIFIVLFLYGFFVFIYSELGLPNHKKYQFGKIISKVLHRQDSKIIVPRQRNNTRPSNSQCPILNIRRRNVLAFQTTVCKEHQPSESGCIFAQKAYGYDAEKRTCDKEPQLEICQIKNGKFDCSNKQCTENKEVAIHIFDVESGSVSEVAKTKSNNELEKLVHEHAMKTIKNNFKFIFLKCSGSVQLLPLNDILFQTKPNRDPVSSSRLNINIVMIDSLSRAHFYRSLHKTIDEFKAINQNNQAEVLDFELFQALHGHSAENAHGLFNGSTFPLGLTDDERESRPVGIQEYYKYFQSKGYNTLYQDDMCYEAIWGFRQDMGGARDWTALYQKLMEGGISDAGLMFANCEIFKKFGSDHIFNLEEENYVCYNGKPHNTYYLHYIANYFGRFDISRERSIAYSALNAAHDYGGVRIQAMDKDLSRFVKLMSKLKNTLTIVLADHGNTYTDFVYIDLEGRYEMFHPSLFMIIPNGVKDILGDNIMNVLRSNQKKLLTMIDLHHTFKYLADANYGNKGILQDLPPSRKCSDLPLRFPNFCVCDGWNTVVDNSTELVGHLEFAVGSLNNIISKSSANSSCKRIVPTLFKNVLQRKDGDYQITTFEIETLPGVGIDSKGEKLNVETRSKLSGSLPNHDMGLNSWDRVSRFGIYRECSDVTDVKFRLCVCDKEVKRKISNITDLFYQRTSRTYDIFNGIVKEKFEVLIKDNLIIVLRTYNEKKYDDEGKEKEPYLIAVTFEVVNFSNVHKTAYSITVKLDDVNNMKQLTSGPCSGIAQPNTVTYLCTVTRKWSIWQAEYSYKFSYNPL